MTPTQFGRNASLALLRLLRQNDSRQAG